MEAVRSGSTCGSRGAASSQSTDQGLFEAGRLAAELVDAIADAQLAWEERTGPGDWYSAADAPHPVYREMVAFALDGECGVSDRVQKASSGMSTVVRSRLSRRSN
ncbi:hypothetical protein [Kitasatospora sp. NPDC017646]|uniref:hypothetical protein n=1 Tax=Kitasatospora sp. NPDC017646 TaxID=3364024 RepID=UPI0037B8A25F